MYSERILSLSSKYTAELYAILAALQHAETANVRDVVLITDSRSVIQEISKHNSTYPIITIIRDKLQRIEKRVKFCWVPSHV